MASAETATEALSGAVKVSWNAAGRKLSGWFQETGGETELIGEMTVDSGGDLDWGMGTGDTFKVGLFARSSGVVSASPPTPWQGNMLASCGSCSSGVPCISSIPKKRSTCFWEH